MTSRATIRSRGLSHESFGSYVVGISLPADLWATNPHDIYQLP